MKTHSNDLRTTSSGFTLIEIITTLSIIMILATITISSFSYFRDATRENKTLVLVRSISHGLEEYRLEHGRYPEADGKSGSSGEFYTALYGDEDGDGYTDKGATNYLPSLNPHLAKSKTPTREYKDYYIVTDSWKNEIFYRCPGEMNPSSDFDLWSMGSDSKGGPESSSTNDQSDDIHNW